MDDWEANRRLAEAISRRAKKEISNQYKMRLTKNSSKRLHQNFRALYHRRQVNNSKDVAQFIINASHGIPKISFEELYKKDC